MEYFPAREPCLLESIPGIDLPPDLRGEQVLGVALPSGRRKGYLAYCDRMPAEPDIDSASRSTILVPHELEASLAAIFPAAKLVAVDDPRARFIDVLDHLAGSGLILPSSLLPESPAVSPDAQVGKRAVIEPGVQIDAGATVGSGAIVCRGTWLKSGASIGENTVVGTVGINAYVGRDGRRRRFPHVAGVIVGEGTTVGAACVVVRGILSSTRLGARSIVGNLCNVGHGVEIGDDVWISAGTTVGGHTRIGDGATVAIGCAIRDNVTIGERANVGMGSVVTKGVRAAGSVFGNPAAAFAKINAGPAR